MTHARTAAAPVEFDRATAVLAGSFAMIAASVGFGVGIETIAPLAAVGAVLAAWHQALFRWPTVVALLISIILFVPIGRYSIPVKLPFGLELYRVAVAFVLAGWGAALLVDPRVRLRRGPFQVPLLIIVCATLGSDVVNIGRVIPLQSAVLKSITFSLSFVLLYYLIVSVVGSRLTVERVTKFLVSGVAVVASFAIVEQRTSFNVFDHVTTVLPFLQFDGPLEVERDSLIRSIASSQHPIALGVLFAMTVPIGLALAFGSGRRWAIPTGVILVGVMASASRSPIIVLLVGAVVIVWLRPREARRLLPLLIPLIIVVKLALPGSIATVKNAFFPAGGLIAEQAQLAREADPLLAGGRVRILGPSLREASGRPLLGQGFGTRQTGTKNPLRNAPILDNQWLGLLLEIGIVGVAGWVMLFVGAVRRLGRASRRRAGPDGWLPVGLAAAVAGFGVGMFTYDSLAFVQIAFVFWIVISLAAAYLLADAKEASTAPSPDPGALSVARLDRGSRVAPST